MATVAKVTRRRRHHKHGQTQNGGIPIFAGAQGCVFKPSLKCRHVIRTRGGDDGNVSKLETKETAEAEMREQDQINQYLKQIPNYTNYFNVQSEICEPDVLEPPDLVNFDNVCTNLQRSNINAANVNTNLRKLRIINMPDLGIDLKMWMEQTAFNPRELNDRILKLLIYAVVPMNRLGVIHNDIKSENVMIDRNDHIRIIDWGLSGVTTPTQVIPVHHFMNNPVTFNRPFSTMIISPNVCNLYSSKFLMTITPSNWDVEFTVERIKQFTRTMYKKYMNAFNINGHKYLHYIFKRMFGSDDATTTDFLMDAIATYNAEILYHFTDRARQTFRLDEYFSKVYRHNTDVWGLMSVFYSPFMMPRNKFIMMTDAAHTNMLHRYRTLFRTVVFANGHERMNVSHIVHQLRQISDDWSNAPRHPRHAKTGRVRVRFMNLNRAPRSKSIKRVATPHPDGNAYYDHFIPLKK